MPAKSQTLKRGAIAVAEPPPAVVRPLWASAVFIAVFTAFLAVPQVRNHPVLMPSFGGAVLALAAWLAFLWMRGGATRRALRIEVVLRSQHYLQAIAHTSIFVYWALYWPEIQNAAALIAGQIVFAYAFDSLLAWSRRDTYTLGFGPFPIIYSTNLFLRFRDDWFYLQFVLVAVGFLVKELVTWQRDGRRTHIFNPSSFPLALASVVLIATGTSHITWAEEIATLLFLPPHIYAFIFLVALPGQFMFRVTTMTLPAVLTVYLFSEIYLRITGTYFFIDTNIPIAVFLGMHLLFTDPSTAPRTELGRVCFGVIYGLAVVGLYAGLSGIGAPRYYDKLLFVPFMNLMVRRIDAIARSPKLRWCDPARLGARLAPNIRSLVYVSTWLIAFGAMTAAKGLSDHHPGLSTPFWQRACDEGRPNACNRLAVVLSNHCRNGSGWSCNELGLLVAAKRVHAAPASDLFGLSCRGGFQMACLNAQAIGKGSQDLHHDDPHFRDYLHILQTGKGPIPETAPADVFGRACAEGWIAACGSLAGVHFAGTGVPRDPARAIELLQQTCTAGHGRSCANLGVMYKRGEGVVRDEAKALHYATEACARGFKPACTLIRKEGA